MDYRMIVLDLDGTLTNRNKEITPRTKEALFELKRQGGIIVLASGRPTYGVMPLARELELHESGGYILSFNGGRIIDCKTGETVFAKELPVSSNARIIRMAEDHGVNILTYENDLIVTPNARDEYVEKEAAINKLEVKEVEDMEAYVQFPVVKFLMLEEGDFLAMVEPKVKAALGRDYSVYRSEPYFLEILPKGIDKAASLERLLLRLGMKRDDMIACGDGYNDLSMIQYAGLGVAMENAVLPVKTAADYVTCSNNHDGVAHVVEKFMLS
ncbi:Cof-type HAD-IIB family hydrolase [Lacrimispora saccharolytica]|uniref:Cof-like hydrolase n=1 Tax=Lacrimispora saccharolytica (strain ATCC 35040 / DSM 2544 / NRCC 2533 / WM1) TaxID=610130 RepID=D9R9U9_LACSW|nr:Cof-type HAD-IIB family hydrolase [Lacrimispora saccharolytica]ADL04149.1 Cof-like hydrolase [[Clostridium] saccharolyticum WM1]QRV21564.1 Cof-type HAD-IIB family hydrolase [Lacrimispora saccharolytica]